MSVTLYKISDVSFRLLGTNGFDAKAKNEKFAAVGSRCHQNLKYENFALSFGRRCQRKCNKKGTARAAVLFFLIQSIISSIRGVAVGVS